MRGSQPLRCRLRDRHRRVGQARAGPDRGAGRRGRAGQVTARQLASPTPGTVCARPAQPPRLSSLKQMMIPLPNRLATSTHNLYRRMLFQPVAQCGVHARLPTLATRLECLDHIGIETNPREHLGRFRFGPPRSYLRPGLLPIRLGIGQRVRVRLGGLGDGGVFLRIRNAGARSK